MATTPAGMPLPASSDPTVWPQIISSKVYTPRKDPYGLSPEEQNFQARQTAERLVIELGNFMGPVFAPGDIRPIAPPVEQQPLQPQPYRRLAGVLVADSVLAIIEMGDGGPAQIVRPGQQVGEWRVISIDNEKAVLRRGGNFRPHEITVRLESRPFGAGGATPNQAPAPGQQPPAGQPGGRFRNPGG